MKHNKTEYHISLIKSPVLAISDVNDNFSVFLLEGVSVVSFVCEDIDAARKRFATLSTVVCYATKDNKIKALASILDEISYDEDGFASKERIMEKIPDKSKEVLWDEVI